MVLSRVDVIVDVVCPWCYIGKRRLEAALAARAERDPPRLTWMPYQLKPDIPLGGIDRRSYLEGKFGGAAGVQQFYDRVSEVGREVGIFFNFERIARQPNTLDAHCLIAWAQAMSPAAASNLVEKLFRGYFVEGLGAAQFATGGAVDRLRALREANSIAIFDTDLVSTCVYAEHYYGSCPDWVTDESATGQP